MSKRTTHNPRVQQTWPENFQQRVARQQQTNAEQEIQNLRQRMIIDIPNATAPAGDELKEEETEDTLRIYYQNVNGLRVGRGMASWHLSLSKMKDMSVHTRSYEVDCGLFLVASKR